MNTGWIKPLNLPRFHYFKNGKSLCGLYSIEYGDAVAERPKFSVRCKQCTRLYMASLTPTQGEKARLEVRQ